MLTPIEAIRKKCLDCCCGQRKEVRLCVIKKCPLYPYRMGTQTKASLQTSDGCSGKSLQE